MAGAGPGNPPRSSDIPPIYEPTPPTWLPQVSTSADLGYHGYFPSHSGLDEQKLTDTNIKNGYDPLRFIGAETFSTKTIISRELGEVAILEDMEDFMNQIFQRRAENVPKISHSTFRVPSRVTLNEAKRNAWFADLANDDVPLSKLGKSVPHGAKGHDLLDLLHLNKVAIPRAVWFLRVFGSNETAGLRNKPNYNPMQYSVDWANTVTSYLKKQLGDIALPSAPRAGLNIKQTFKGVLSDSDSREQWISRFSYSLQLLRVFYQEGMVDHGTFLSWLVQQMVSCNLAQASFVARLLDDYLDDLVSNRALSKFLVDGCLMKLSEISSSSSREALLQLQTRLIHLLRRLFLASPATFVSPSTWKKNVLTLRHIFLDNFVPMTSDEPHILQNAQAIRQFVLQNYVDVGRRNNALMLKSLPRRTEGRLKFAVSDVQLLNSICSTTDLSTIAFFDPSPSSSPLSSYTWQSQFQQKLDVLLGWCTTPFQYGDHRPYAAITILDFWRSKSSERATRRGDYRLPDRDEILQDQLFDWLDSSDLAIDERNRANVSILFGDLIERDLFSYDKYIQRIIARGEVGLSMNEEPGSRHRNLLRSIPLYKSDYALSNQRKVALYGVRTRETPEDRNEKEIRRELRSIFPSLFGGESPETPPSLSALWSEISTLRNATRYEQVRMVKHWLLPIVWRYLSRARASVDIMRLYCKLIQVMEFVKFYRSMLQITLRVLSQATTNDVLMTVIETINRYADIWHCMNSSDSIAQTLIAAHQRWKENGVHNATLVSLLIRVDNGKYLDDSVRQQLNSEVAHYAQALCPIDENPEVVPPVLPEILLLAQDFRPNAPSNLANSLWYKYRTSADWAWTVWDNVIASLRQVPLMALDISARRACTLRYASFLIDVDQHLTGGLDAHALRWFLGSGLNEISALATEAWDILTVLCLNLCVHGAITVTTLLKGIVYPGLQLGMAANSPQQWQSAQTFVRAALDLCHRLLINEDNASDGLSPANLLEVQKLRTRRREVYWEEHFSLLMNNIPNLVFLEHNRLADSNIRDTVKNLRNSICKSPELRQGTYRNLNALRSAFEQSLQLEAQRDDLHEPLIQCLRLILSDSDGGEHSHIYAKKAEDTMLRVETIFQEEEAGEFKEFANDSLLSPWKIAASAISLEFVLKQLGEGLLREARREHSHAQLDKFTARLLHHTMSAEQADFVAEMARNISLGVADKFAHNGVRRITEILRSIQCTPEELSLGVEQAGQFLRLLCNVLEPFKDKASAELVLNSEVQEALAQTLLDKFLAIEVYLDSEHDYQQKLTVTDALVFLLRLLQFLLGFSSVMRQLNRTTAKDIFNVLFKLSMSRWNAECADETPFLVLLDTMFYTFDELPIDNKSNINDLFQYCPTLDPSCLPLYLPSRHRAQLSSMLRYTDRNTIVSNLHYATRDESGNLVLGGAVQNRPWEWIENLGDPPVLDGKDPTSASEEKNKYAVKNNASISLELFDACVTGSGVIHGNEEEIRAMHMFEDSLDTFSLQQRDWLDMKIEPNWQSSNHMDVDEGRIAGPSGMQTAGGPSSPYSKAPSRRGSPVGSTNSRSSATVHTGSGSGVRLGRDSPLSRGSSARDPIDVDGFPILHSGHGSAGAASKRTNSMSVDEDLLGGEEKAGSSKRSRTGGKGRASVRKK